MVPVGDGVRLRMWTTGPAEPHRLPVVMVNGGPGLADYLAPVAEFIDDFVPVHRYDQRGTGGSAWVGTHTLVRHLADLESLLDRLGHERAVLVGHSFGTDLTNHFLLAHPDRVAGLIQLAGPFLGPWREASRITEQARRSSEQQERFANLARTNHRTEAEELEFLTLSWFTDHADSDRARGWAAAAAHALRPVNYAMNAELNAAKKADPLESRVVDLRRLMPAGSLIIGGAGDPRPAEVLRRHGEQVDCEVAIIPDAGHHPWLEAPEAFRSVFRRAVEGLTQPDVSA